MSVSEIEAELRCLGADDLRRIALSSWTAFLEKEHREPAFNACNEDDPELLAALDEAVRQADGSGPQGYSAAEVRSRIGQWTTK